MKNENPADDNSELLQKYCILQGVPTIVTAIVQYAIYCRSNILRLGPDDKATAAIQSVLLLPE
jgi:hypothetical protein